MIIKKVYDENSHTQRVWYNSTMIAYTEMVEDENENKGNLFVTFRNGSTYVYKNVEFQDYMAFIGGATDGSQGKTLNRAIKPKYDCEKVKGKSLSEIENALNEIQAMERKEKERIEHTWFISGHRDITPVEFEINYAPAIESVLNCDDDALFVVGDYYGTDIMAQNYLVETLNVDPDRLTVYHMFDSPRNCNPKIKNLKGGFSTDDMRDIAMTEDSSHDIAFVRDWTKISGTAQNILRRHQLLNV